MYTLTPVQAELVVLTFQLLEDGKEKDRMSLDQFAKRFPEGMPDLERRLEMISLELERGCR